MILDTNALSAWADGHPACRQSFADASRLVVPSIVLGEYFHGIRQSRHKPRYEEWLAANLPFTEIQGISDITASLYADIRIQLKNNGTPIPANDLWIAALTMEIKLPLLSNDAHFDRIPGLLRLPF